MIKQKFLFLLLFFIATTGVLKAQEKDPYIPVFIDTDTVLWWEVDVTESKDTLLAPCTVSEYMYNDTLYYYNGGTWFLEDTINRTIFMLSSEPEISTSKTIMYDFSLKEGDSTFLRNYMGVFYWWYVDSIRYVDTYAGKRKAWYFHYDDDEVYPEHPIWVEGIGSLAGFRRNSKQPRLDWWGWGILNCWYTNELLVYKSDFAEQWGCALEYLDIFEENIPNIKLYPNPVTDISFIEFDNPECKYYDITFYNILGNKIFSETTNSQIYKLNASSFGTGVYFYVISKDDKLIYSEKFIVKQN